MTTELDEFKHHVAKRKAAGFTITAIKRTRSPKAYARKDARTAIFNAMYGKGDKRNNHPAEYDPNRMHSDITRVDWDSVRTVILVYWKDAQFSEVTLNKILSDFFHYSGKPLTRAELSA
jgi:hypothetical protein